jgi:hypothetical protein
MPRQFTDASSLDTRAHWRWHAGVYTHLSECRVKQPNTMHKASQQILANAVSRAVPSAAEPTQPGSLAALTVEEGSDMSNTFCLSHNSSGTPRRSPLVSIFHGLLCRSSSSHSQSSSRSLAPRSCQDDSRICHEREGSAGGDASAMSFGGDGSVYRDPSSSRRGGTTDATGLEHSRMGMCEPRMMHVQPDQFVLDGRSVDTIWERDMRSESSTYVYLAHCPYRWFLLQHEAANAMRMHASLAL